MTINGSLARELVDALSAQTNFPGITFVEAYENEIKPTPVDDTIVAISVKGCEIGPKLQKTLDTGEIVETDSREMNTTVSADIYLPYSMGGGLGHKVFDKLSTFFFFTADYEISKAFCYATDYDRTCEAIVLRTCFVFNNIISE